MYALRKIWNSKTGLVASMWGEGAPEILLPTLKTHGRDTVKVPP